MSDETLLTLTADIVAAHLSNNSVATSDLPGLISSVHASLHALGTPVAPKPEVLTPAVSVRSSVKPDYIVCLEDGKKLKMLKRHLMTHYQLTPEQYRAKWKLPADYPMVAPDYAEQRKALAIKIGLGRKPKATAPTPVAAKPAGKTRVRKSPADAKAAAVAHLSGN